MARYFRRRKFCRFTAENVVEIRLQRYRYIKELHF